MALYSAQPGDDRDLRGDGEEEDSWVLLARDAYRTSTDYFDSNVRRKTEDALAHFSNRHAQGSKYYSDPYKYRFRGFRPKTRSVIRRNEAAAAVAYFSTQDALDISPENGRDEYQLFTAELNRNLLNYRLEHTIPWFMTLIGAYQDTMNTGVVISHQHWRYEEDETGRQAVDTPRIDLIPIENFRFAQSADWRDPVGTSPYIIELMPMYVGDIRDRAKKTDPKTGEPEWAEVDDKEIKAASEWDYDSVRSAREGRRQDAKDATHSYSDFDIAWVHRNIVRKDGQDWLYYTLGVVKLLSDPVPLREVYEHLGYRERPYVMGSAVIETHKTYPDSINTLVGSLQREANDISNQRRDNVQQILNKRHYARRGAAIDWKMLRKSVPGSIVLMDDINNDVKPEEIRDITGSAYEEQNRVNVDFDELAGSFSAGSVATNRQMNETVGGMNLLKSDSNIISEYQLRCFNETWVEPVLKQLLKLEQSYESDQYILDTIGAQSSAQDYGIQQIFPNMLQGEMNVRINVGFGSTSPEQRLQKIVLGLDSVLKYRPEAAMQLDFAEVAKEIFGALGYKNTERFFPGIAGGEDQVAQLQDQVMQLQQALEDKTVDTQAREQAKAQTQIEAAQIKSQADLEKQASQQEFEAWDSERNRELEREKLSVKQQEAIMKTIGNTGQK